ncbi:hypothetical protein AB0H28_27335 [Micromonospora sp. NPDC050980]|uniref:hypothetical protein n=1 Tax=Micromonospora sp. NPDC050980 TaxID=3155161 RepID=UPI0033F05E97
MVWIRLGRQWTKVVQSVGRANFDHHDEAERLQQALRISHDELAATESGTAAYRAQRSEVFAATTQLLSFEAQLPVLLDEQRRRVSSRVVYAAGVVTVAAMLVIIGAIMASWVSRWYLAPVVPVALMAIVITVSEPRARRLGHRGRAAGALISVACAALVAVAVLRVVSAFWLLALIPLVVIVLSCWLPDGAEAEGTT